MRVENEITERYHEHTKNKKQKQFKTKNKKGRKEIRIPTTERYWKRADAIEDRIHFHRENFRENTLLSACAWMSKLSSCSQA